MSKRLNINPSAVQLILDTWEGPDCYCVFTVDAADQLLDILDFPAFPEAEAAAKAASAASGLKITLHETPPGVFIS